MTTNERQRVYLVWSGLYGSELVRIFATRKAAEAFLDGLTLQVERCDDGESDWFAATVVSADGTVIDYPGGAKTAGKARERTLQWRDEYSIEEYEVWE